MAISQIGEYIEDINDIVIVVNTLMKTMVHQNPKIRWASFHCLGQFADDLCPEFGANFH